MTVATLDRPTYRDRYLAQELGMPMRAFLGAVAGALLAVGYALHPHWWAPWLAPIPLIVAASGTRGSARLAGGIAGAVAATSVLPYYIGLTGWPVALLITVLRVGSWLLAAELTTAAARRLPFAAAVFVLPSAIAAIELLTMVASPHGAAGSLAYSQMDVGGIVQVAAVGGVPAVVFLVLLPGSLVGLWCADRRTRAERVAGSAVVSAIGLAAAMFAVVRLGPSRGGNAVPVTLIATNRFKGSPEDWDRVWAVYQPAVLAYAVRDGLVVLPEKLALLDAAGSAHAAQGVSAAARTTGATVIVGIEEHDRGVYRNRALVAAPDGRLTWYDKQRLVPGWEDRDVPGSTPMFTDVAGTRVGVAICKDMHIPEIGREYAGAAQIMTVPAWDFGQDGWMGARMTAMRAIENGYAVARSARDGYLGAYDRTGRVVVERPVTGDDVTVATATLPARGAATLYSRVGNAFGWLCVCLTGLLLIWLAADGRRGRVSR